MQGKGKRFWAAGAVLACAAMVLCGVFVWRGRQKDMEAGNREKKEMGLSNPISSVEEDTWYDYGTGDPYVMRYNGKYYLYMSTRDTEAGVKCFSSQDLVSWEYEGLCTEERVTKGAYAPEVVYYNGMFYMYTSPAGNGHYVLASNSPTGPFEVISENLGLSIDGSVFIDDNGDWYFYRASDTGIQAHRMSAPNEMAAASLDVHASMDGWTEGPMVIKHDGRYYLTYTGNHVFSKGYRIDYGVGDSPRRFEPAEENPVLIQTLGDVSGIGHSSTVKGPDLDSYYIVYHSLVGRAKEGMPKRVMNIDRIVFNGDRMDILGPTTTEQQMPDMPDIYAYFGNGAKLEELEGEDGWEFQNAEIEEDALMVADGGYAFSKKKLGETFTAEYNLCSSDRNGQLGGYFNYIDGKNYARFVLELGKQTIIVEIVKNGEKKALEFTLPSSFGEAANLAANQAFQVEKKGPQYEIYFNDRYLGDFECDLPDGKIGYFAEGCTARCGFIGGTDTVGGLSARTYEKPLPGTVQGVHYLACSDSIEEVDGYAATKSIVGTAKKNTLDYAVNVKEDGAYDFSMFYAAKDKAQYAIYMDGALITKAKEELEATAEDGQQYKTEILRNLELKQGIHTLRIVLYGAGTEISEFSFSKYEEVEAVMLECDTVWDDYTYADGKWRSKNGKLVVDEIKQSVGKRLYGSESLGDYTVEADIAFTGNGMDAGLIFRAANPALGGGGNDPVLGTYFIQGYYAAIRKNALVLFKINYNCKELESVPMEFSAGQVYHLSATVDGDEIRISVDGKECITYQDDRPFIHGAAGIRSYQSLIEVDHIEIKPLQ